MALHGRNLEFATWRFCWTREWKIMLATQEDCWSLLFIAFIGDFPHTKMKTAYLGERLQISHTKTSYTWNCSRSLCTTMPVCYWHFKQYLYRYSAHAHTLTYLVGNAVCRLFNTASAIWYMYRWMHCPTIYHGRRQLLKGGREAHPVVKLYIRLQKSLLHNFTSNASYMCPSMHWFIDS